MSNLRWFPAVALALQTLSCASAREQQSSFENTQLHSLPLMRSAQVAMRDSDKIPVGQSPVIGNPNALVTMVVFSDLQCPYCSRIASTIAQLREHYGADLRVVWKNHPLPFHQFAEPAAQLAMEAYEQQGNEGFWRIHDAVFADQRDLSLDKLLSIAAENQLNVERARLAITSHIHSQELDADHDLAVQLGVNGTPHTFINGTEVSGARPYDQFVSIIDRVLERAQTISPRESVYAVMTNDPVDAPERPSRPPPVARNVRPNTPPPRIVLAPQPNLPMRGSATAPVVIDVFSDFQCPFCARAEPTLEAVMQQYGQQVRLVWHNYPLPFHNNAHLAAEAATEAYVQKGNAGFWRYHDLLFSHQSALSRTDLETYARQTQLDIRRFRAALDQHTHTQTVDKEIQAADATGVVDGTPVFLINGISLVGAQPIDEFKRVIDAELQQPNHP